MLCGRLNYYYYYYYDVVVVVVVLSAINTPESKHLFFLRQPDGGSGVLSSSCSGANSLYNPETTKAVANTR